MVRHCTVAGRSNFFYAYAAENPTSTWNDVASINRPSYARDLLRDKWTKVVDGERVTETPIDTIINSNLESTDRTYLEALIALREAYFLYIGSNAGAYHVDVGEAEKTRGKTLFDLRLENYRRLSVRDFLGFNFKEYIDNPRWVIAEYDNKCAKWSQATPPLPADLPQLLK